MEKKEINSVLYRADMLRTLVNEHKTNCNSAHCTVATYLIYDTFYLPYMEMNGRSVEAKKNLKEFL